MGDPKVIFLSGAGVTKDVEKGKKIIWKNNPLG